MFEIRAYQEGDKDKLRDLIMSVWPDRPAEAFDNRWWWQFEKPPLYVIEEIDNGLIVGLCAYIDFDLFSNGSLTQGAWLVDFFVSDRCQGAGLGKRLTQAVMERHNIIASMSQTDAAWRAFQKLGWHDRQRASLFLNPLPLVPMAMPLARKLASKAKNSEIRIIDILNRDSLSMYEDDLEELWSSIRDRFDAITCRNADALWNRYAPKKNRTYRLSCSYRDGKLIGYMISRLCPPNSLRSLKRLPIGLIVDYLVPPEEYLVFGSLIDEASRSLTELGAKCILCLSTVPEFQKRLISRGYLHSNTPFIGRKLAAMSVGFTCYSDGESKDVGNLKWFLTMGDCDMDRIWGEAPA
jgi:GNAT superfamily N-acetyltransferase